MAATDLERLVVQLSADINKFDKSLARAQGVANKRLGQIESRFAKMSKTLNAGAATATAGLARTFAVIGGAQGLKTLTDSATRIDNALKVAGLSGSELESVYQSLFAAATKNAAPIETLVGLYGRLALVQNELGVSQQQIVGFTNNIALALRVGGTSATEASGALLQLSQALGGGVVRAEEFNSVLEGAPTILQAAAAGIKEADGSVAKLRQIMLHGKLSSKAFFDGFQAGAPVLEQKVAGAVLTIDQRLTNLNTALINAAREFNNSAKAGEAFGSEIDRVAGFINSINFDAVIGQIQAIINTLNSGIAAANGLAQAIGNLAGLDVVGSSLVNMLGGENGKASFFGGALTIEATRAAADQTNLAEKRLGIEKQIADLKAQPPNPDIEKTIAKLQAQLPAVQRDLATVAPKIEGGPLVYDRFKPPSAPSTVTPISVADKKYSVPASSSGGGKKKGGGGGRGANEYQREIEQIKERTTALQAETAAMGQVNPLINDYGFALEKARAESDLLAAAQKAGMTITPELRANIEQLATGYANASVAAEKLAKNQDRARETAEEFKSMSKDIASGFISDLRSGASAADALSNALDKVLDKVIDIGLNSIFGLGGGGGGLFGGIGKLFGFAKGGIAANGRPVPTFGKGGVSNSAAIFGEAGPEAAVPLPDGRSIPVKFQTPAIPKRGSSGSQDVHVTVGVSADNNGNLMPFVESVSQAQVQKAAPKIVSAANQNVVPTVAKHQASKAGAEWRT